MARECFGVGLARWRRAMSSAISDAAGIYPGNPPERPAPAAQSARAIDWGQQVRLGGLRRFAFAITLLNVVGHGFLGFETSWLHPLAALATGYSVELLLETIDARASRRVARYRVGGLTGFTDFLLSAHISSLAVSMLLYANEHLAPVIFATSLAIGSKLALRIEAGGRVRHFMNPSNLGIATTLLLFPWVGIAPPYQFTENIAGPWDWAFPLLIVGTGSFINTRFTRRLPLLLAWLGGFAAQALLRHWLLGSALGPALAPMTGLAFLLFTFYMVTDPPTTPSSTRNQVLFGLATAATYGLLMASHIVFGLFFSLVIVCFARGGWLYFASLARRAQTRSA
jgi:hypothetical protein